VDGYVRVDPDADVEYRSVPGRHSITAPNHARFLPNWALRCVQGNEPGYRPADRVKVLDLEVAGPGVVRVEGIWLERFHGVIITSQMLHFVQADPKLARSIAFSGAGVDSVLHYTGPITAALFGFGDAEQRAHRSSNLL
jgi:hypothetical protein